MTYTHGIRENLRPSLEKLLQVFFVGLTIGVQRTVIPALAETEFGVVQGSMTTIFALVIWRNHTRPDAARRLASIVSGGILAMPSGRSPWG